jgi:CAAX prenyl protease-like protein
MFIRIVPFALYMLFIALNSFMGWLATYVPGVENWTAVCELWSYPVRILAVIFCLVAFWQGYEELREVKLGDLAGVILPLAVGIAVYFLWVRMDWGWAMQHEAGGYNPFLVGAGAGVVLAIVRLFGASVVVPVMEELFWRSFLIRYIINPEFKSVPLGRFTPASFAITVLLFGLEHNLWLAGMMAGVAYNFVLYRTNNLWSCILAHAVTNVSLGVHVLITSEWRWW